MHLRNLALTGTATAVAVAAALTLGAPSANAILIDGFGDAQGPVTDNTANGSAVSGGLLNITDTDLPGTVSRRLTAELTEIVTGTPSVTAEVGGGVYQHSQAAGGKGSSAADWSFSDAIDLSSAGLALKILVVFADLNGGEIDFTLTDSSTSSDTQSVAIPQTASGGAPLTNTLLLPLAGFAGIDLQDIVAAQLFVDGESINGLDVQIDLVEVPVPEPATLALIGAGLAGLGVAGRRRRRAAA